MITYLYLVQSGMSVYAIKQAVSEAINIGTIDAVSFRQRQQFICSLTMQSLPHHFWGKFTFVNWHRIFLISSTKLRFSVNFHSLRVLQEEHQHPHTIRPQHV